MASNDHGWLYKSGTAFLIVFGVFSLYVVYFALNNPQLVGEGIFYEAFFGVLAIASFVWAAMRLGLIGGGNGGQPTP